MAYTDFQYDRDATNSSNYLTDRIYDVIDRGIIPVDGAFYDDDFKIEGRYGDGAWVELKYGTDYVFSPLFVRVSAATGKLVYSYIVLTYKDISTYTQVKLDTRHVGEYEDSDVLNQVAKLTPEERLLVKDWLKITEINTYPSDTRDPTLKNKSVMEVVAAGLEKINSSLGALTPPASGNLDVQITQLQQSLAELSTTVTDFISNHVDGGGSGGGVDYGDVIFASFISLSGTSTSNTYHPFTSTMYSYLDIWLEGETVSDDTIDVSILKNGVEAGTYSLAAGTNYVRATIASQISVSNTDRIELSVTNNSALASTVHVRLQQLNT